MYNGVYKLYSALREKEFKKIIEVIITDRSIEFTIERRKCRPYYGERINRIFHKKMRKILKNTPFFLLPVQTSEGVIYSGYDNTSNLILRRTYI